MNKTTLTLALLGTLCAAPAMAGEHGGPSWDNWTQLAGGTLGSAPMRVDAPRGAASAVPAGTASYTGSTVAIVRIGGMNPVQAAPGNGSINDELSRAVVVTPAVAATSTTAAVPAVVSAPLSATGAWNFVATSTLKVNGSFASVKN